jgi:hypothetical protein
VGKNGNAELDGLYQVLKDNPLVETAEGNILLCKPVKKVEGRLLGNRKSWELAATETVKSEPNCEKWKWKIEEFSNRFLHSTAWTRGSQAYPPRGVVAGTDSR